MPIRPLQRLRAAIAESISVRHWSLSFVAMLATVALTALAIVSPATPASAGPVEDEVSFVEMINELRVSQGLNELATDPELESGARIWAEELRAAGALSHAPDLSVGVTSSWSKLGENVGVAPGNQIEALFQAFIDSPDHYANLIDPSFTNVGVGVTYDDEGRLWTTHRFMATAAAPTPPTSQQVDEAATSTETTEPPALPDQDATTSTAPTPPTTVPATTSTTATAPTTEAQPTSTALEPVTARTPQPETTPLDSDIVAAVLDSLVAAGI